MEMKDEALALADEWDWMTEEKLSKWGDDAQAMIRRLVEELDKQSEPVAWMDKYGNVCTDIQKKMYQGNITAQYNYDKNTIPLYTAPQSKPLHEDIIYGLCYKYGIEKGDVLKFARAIEERHGIK